AILGYMTGPASRLIGINKIYQNANIAADRLFEIMDLERPKNEGDIENDDFLKQDIEFKDVEFSYGTRGNLFSNFNIVIPGGKITAIIGESGSGKSSLANLINGLYETSSGSISIGKHKICNYTKESLSKCIAIIPQHTDLFVGSILQNIAPGEIKADTERALEICYRLGLQSFLHSLPEGINTQVGEKGFTLSGGERQRISIARALYRNPSVLILDESTSSLDKETEARVMDIINDKKEAERTVIIISHRLHSIIDADKIIMLEGGEVIEQGDHLSLLNKGGRYCELMNVHGTAV
ncbi:MAG: ABC transporter ATP-binding protein, partial [Bacteroidales bacterium]|nr:ABC transporter ATP-binding protein [Bacteroidales bacterium]